MSDGSAIDTRQSPGPVESRIRDGRYMINGRIKVQSGHGEPKEARREIPFAFLFLFVGRFSNTQ
jgi:hypothetical protein